MRIKLSYTAKGDVPANVVKLLLEARELGFEVSTLPSVEDRVLDMVKLDSTGKVENRISLIREYRSLQKEETGKAPLLVDCKRFVEELLDREGIVWRTAVSSPPATPKPEKLATPWYEDSSSWEDVDPYNPLQA